MADHDFETVDSQTLYVGNIFALRADDVRMPSGATARREVVEHYGAEKEKTRAWRRILEQTTGTLLRQSAGQQ